MKQVKGFVFFDLDGTLLNQNSEVDPTVAEAVKQLRINGYMPVIATGRTDMELQTILEQTGINSVISMNGQHIQFDGKEIASQIISTSICERMLKMTKEKGHELAFYTSEAIRVTNVTPQVVDCYQYIHRAAPPVDAQFYQKQAINMLLVISRDGDADYHAAFPELTFFRNGPHSIDSITKGGSKGQAVRTLQAALELMDVPTYAFGDGLNDVDLFHNCDYGIAMGNARDVLKKAASYITAANDDGGIIQGLKHYHLL